MTDISKPAALPALPARLAHGLGEFRRRLIYGRTSDYIQEISIMRVGTSKDSSAAQSCVVTRDHAISRMFQQGLTFLTLVLGVASLCSASTMTYSVSLVIDGTGSVTGNIVTDGVLGTLSQSDIVGWSLTASNGFNTPVNLTGSDSTLDEYGFDLSATANNLLFNFSATDGGALYFEGGKNPSYGFVCFGPSDILCAYPQLGDVEGLDDGPTLFNAADELNTPLSGTQVIAIARSTPAAPEPSTFFLLGAGIAFIGLHKLRI